jgi:hypothetical protein
MKRERKNVMRLASLLFTGTVCALALTAQTFEFRSVVQPGSVIAGHRFSDLTSIGGVAINDNGEFAFMATFVDEEGPGAALFTSQRIVVRSGDAIDGKPILFFPKYAGIAINKAGQVAFEAEYLESQGPRSRETGIFVDNHLAVAGLYGPVPFSLTDDGRVELERPTRAQQAPASQRKPSLLDRVGIKPPKLPNNVPVTIAPEPQGPQHQAMGRPPLASPALFEGISVNRRGEVLIPVNLVPRGFMLLLGTHTSVAPGRR